MYPLLLSSFNDIARTCSYLQNIYIDYLVYCDDQRKGKPEIRQTNNVCACQFVFSYKKFRIQERNSRFVPSDNTSVVRVSMGRLPSSKIMRNDVDSLFFP